MTAKLKRWNGKVIWTAVIVALVTSIVNSGVLVKLMQDSLQPIARPDPFYGVDGARLEARIVVLERRVSELERP